MSQLRPRHPHRDFTQSVTLRLDHWASILRNDDTPLNDDEAMELSTLLTEACNTICDLSRRSIPPG